MLSPLEIHSMTPGIALSFGDEQGRCPGVKSRAMSTMPLGYSASRKIHSAALFPSQDNPSACTCVILIKPSYATITSHSSEGSKNRSLLYPLQCPAFPAATCEANYCGGCNADWFVNGHKVDCNASSPSHTIPCRQGGNVKPIECPESYSCYLNPVSSPLPNKDASRQGVCLPTGEFNSRLKYVFFCDKARSGHGMILIEHCRSYIKFTNDVGSCIRSL